MNTSNRGGGARWLAGVLLLACCLGLGASQTPQSLPNPRPAGAGHIANPEGIIDAQHAEQIESLLTRLEADKGIQVAVVAVADIDDPADVFDFAQQLFERWGVGDRSRDDGLLILLVRDRRTVRMHTGYGLEGLLPDLLCRRIQERFMTPAFKAGHYGEGLLLGLSEVDRLVRDPDAAAQAIATLPQPSDPWPLMRWVVSVPIAVVGLLLFAVRSVRGYFSQEVEGNALPPVSMRYARWSWLTCSMLLPLGLVQLAGALPVGLRVGGMFLFLYTYFLLMALQQAWRLHCCARTLFANHAHVRLHQFLGQQRAFWVWMAIWMPAPFLLYLPYVWALRERYRRKARPCEACGQVTRRLSEQEEDAHLSAARRAEERLGSVDHDVWLCGGCGATHRVSFPNDDAAFEACPKCNTVAMRVVSDTELKSASATQTGQGVRKHACQHCGHQRKERYVIARMVPSSDASTSSTPFGASSSGSSGSSASSSWGGGSSGGGGASASW